MLIQKETAVYHPKGYRGIRMANNNYMTPITSQVNDSDHSKRFYPHQGATGIRRHTRQANSTNKSTSRIERKTLHGKRAKKVHKYSKAFFN
ncbi:hypothetical protein HOK76_01115 [archaeon]|nr:hypothetical protein [archaeon]